MSDEDAKARRDFAEEVVVKLRRAGFHALWAGGCVRDILMGLTPADYDVATDATPEQAMKALPYRALAIGASFGVVKVRHPRQKGNEVEVATFRSDLAYIDGRRPVGVVYSSPREDAERRDFTLNGLFMDPTTGEVIDHVGGRADLEARVLRAIGDPAARFEEDKLRLLRAARFAARFDLAIEPETWKAVRAMASQIGVVSPERIAQELRKMLEHPNRAGAVGLLIDGGLLAAVLPPFDAMDADAQGRAARTLGLLPPDAGFPLAMAALLREIGGDRPDPEAAAARIADDLARGLRLSNTERERIVWLVRHQRSLVDAERLRQSALKRLLASPGIDELLDLHRAAAIARDADAGHVDFCRRHLEHQPSGPIDPPPLLTGNDLIRHGLKPGVEFTAILEKVRDAQLESRIRDRDEALEYVDRELTPARTEPPEAERP
jgi:poly(A) polymerase